MRRGTGTGRRDVVARRLRVVSAPVALVVAAEAALVLSGSGQAVALTPAAAATSASPAVKATGPAEARSEASAALAAKLQGRRIEVLDDRTDASQTFANPDGSFSYVATPDPQRVKKDGVWKDLDATLAKNGDGTYSPVQSESPLTLSGGGTAPLAVMTVDGKQTTLTWPDSLPAPTASGATLTYPDVLASGVDL